MNGNTSFLLSLSIIFPFLIGLVRYKKIQDNYQPFLIYIIISFVSEIISYLLIKVFRTNLVFLNIFSLVECFVLVIQFHKWGFLGKRRHFYAFLAILFIGWVTENFLLSDISRTNRIFLIAYSFLLVLLSIRELNHAMILSNRALYDNARFIICIGMIVFFTFNIIAQTFRFFGSGFSKEFMKHLFSIVAYTNAITNVVYAFGVYNIPKKRDTDAIFDERG